MTQEEIDNKIWRLNCKIHANELENNDFKKQIQELKKKAMELDDEHALIPNNYKTIDEWLAGHPFPRAVNSMRFKNKSIAESVQLCCNTYQQDFHIVKSN